MRRVVAGAAPAPSTCTVPADDAGGPDEWTAGFHMQAGSSRGRSRRWRGRVSLLVRCGSPSPPAGRLLGVNPKSCYRSPTRGPSTRRQRALTTPPPLWRRPGGARRGHRHTPAYLSAAVLDAGRRSSCGIAPSDSPARAAPTPAFTGAQLRRDVSTFVKREGDKATLARRKRRRAPSSSAHQTNGRVSRRSATSRFRPFPSPLRALSAPSRSGRPGAPTSSG
jgi:hypothetical protein